MATSPPRSRLAFVDALRALAALWVLAYDAWTFHHGPDLGPLTAIFQSGHLGVEVFMVLSGFCLFYPLARRTTWLPGTWRGFFARRARRILPPYYVAMVYAVALPYVMASSFQALGLLASPPSWPSIWQWISHVTLIHNLFPDVRSGINPSFWSLSLEAQFYLLFPLLAIALARWRAKGLAAIVLACLGYRLAIYLGWGPTWDAGASNAYNAILGRALIFVAGMVAAWRVATARPAGLRVPGWLWLAIVPGGLALGYYLYFHPLGILPLSDVVIGLVIGTFLWHGGATPGRLVRALSHPYLVALGEISYSLYLIDRPTVYYVSLVVGRLFSGSDAHQLLLTLAIGTPISIALALRFHLWFERPFMQGGRREAAAAPRVPVAG